MLIDGRKIAAEIIKKLKRRPKSKKSLAAILVGTDPASLSFLRQKERVSRELGIPFTLHRLPERAREATVIRLIKTLNRKQTVGGIVLQLPLPKHLDRDRIIRVLSPRKDVDAFRSSQYVFPPAVQVVRTILEGLGLTGGNGTSKNSLQRIRAVVIGRGFLVGAPVAAWLEPRVQKLDILHKTSFDRKALRAADLVVSGAGKPGLVKGSWLKRGVVAIDFGYGMWKGEVSGDFEFKSSQKRVGAITPTPGGTGPILVAELFRNFYKLTTQPRR